MDTNQFRRGNLVTTEFLDLEFEVKAVYPEGLLLDKLDSCPEHECVIDNIKGIPLTEEQLLRFGFKDGGQSQKLFRVFKISKGNGGYHLHVGNMFQTMTAQDVGVKLEYVHQLQNLYFVLTGEELQIKEEVTNGNG